MSALGIKNLRIETTSYRFAFESRHGDHVEGELWLGQDGDIDRVLIGVEHMKKGAGTRTLRSFPLDTLRKAAVSCSHPRIEP